MPQEHGYRFDKQSLRWEQPRLQTPEQFERWSHIVAIVHNHLVLASPLVEPELRPWESKQRSASLQQVRRGMNKLLIQLGTPAKPPKPRGKAKGRSTGAKQAREDTVFCRSQKTITASTCLIVTLLSAFGSVVFLFTEHLTMFWRARLV